MKLLLDTHIILWWISGQESFSPRAKTFLLSGEHALYVSIVSAWEVAVKVSIGKLPELNGGVKTFLAKVEEMPISLIGVEPCHIELIEKLPFIHRDPFDRLLISAAKMEGMTIITADENIHRYDVPTLW